MQSVSETSNPFIRQVPVGQALSREKVTTYLGVSMKVLFFFLVTFIGVAFYYLFPVAPSLEPTLMIGATVVGIGTSIICYKAPTATPCAGTIFTFVYGYIIGYLCYYYSYLYEGIVPLALIVTFCVVFAMLILYGTGIIKVGKRFRAVVSTLFFASVIIGLFTFASSFITPFFADLLFGDTLLGLGISALFVVIATLHLAIDFDNIVYGVQNQTEKKYEWVYAFGLASTVIVLFIRILSLLARLRN